MKRSTLTAAVGLMLATLAGGLTPAAAAPGEITYQGRLQASGGAYSGPADIQYALFGSETGGSPLATRLHAGATVVDGVFTTALDFGAALPPGDAWLEIAVRTPGDGGAFTTITPRQKLTGAPSAAWSSAPWAYDPAAGTVTLSRVSPGNTVLLSNHLGVNMSPVYPLDVAGDSSAIVARFRSGSTGVVTVDAQANGGGGIAVRGTAPSSSSWAGYFDGKAYAAMLGVGVADPGTILHVVGNNRLGIARIADTTVGGGQSIGVYASTTNPAGTALYGEATAAGSIGLQGNQFAAGTAVAGSLFGATGQAVFGGCTQPANTYAGLFQGRTAASGTKSFLIDHPLDPANKTLAHYCSEGPEPLNLYQGTVVTDGAGFATVELPDYFGAINTDVRYQLTVIDESDEFVLAKVAHRVENNRFVIRTSVGNVEVSWQVSGVRNDAFVRAYGAPVEMDKPEDKRGTFLAPELYHGPAMIEAGAPAQARTGAVR